MQSNWVSMVQSPVGLHVDLPVYAQAKICYGNYVTPCLGGDIGKFLDDSYWPKLLSQEQVLTS